MVVAGQGILGGYPCGGASKLFGGAVDIVLGVSMAPETVRMVLVEGENADGATVEEDSIPVSTDGDNQDLATLTAPNQVVSAILGTRESATQGGHQLTSTGVTWTDPAEAAALRDLLAAHKLENVMLVSAFLSAAALTQSVGNAVGYNQTALLFVEPDTATLAVVDTADGSITEMQKRPLSADDAEAVRQLSEMAAAAEALESRPQGLFVVGSDVDVAMIKPQLEAATTLVVNAPDEPDMALARGAALASAHAPLFESSTVAQAYAQVPGTGVVEPGAAAPAEAVMAAPGYAGFVQGAADHDDGDMTQALAYSADPDSTANAYTAVAGAEGAELVAGGAFDADVGDQRPARKPFLVAMSALTIFVVGVAALAIALALNIRPKVNDRPNLGQRMVVPTKQAPSPPQAPAPSAPAPAAPAPAPAAPAPAPAPAGPAPAPAPAVPAPPPVAPPAVPVAPPRVPAPANPIPGPNIPGPKLPGPGIPGPGIPGPNIPGPPIPGIGHGGGGPGIPGIGGGIPGIPHF